jgi:hypothetical protein
MSGREFGSGINIDSSFDFSINQNGDLEKVDGVEELNKDLAIQLSIALDEFRGQPLDNELKAEVKQQTIDTISADVRVQTVRSGRFQVDKPTRDTLAVKVPYITQNTEQELVFTAGQ